MSHIEETLKLGKQCAIANIIEEIKDVLCKYELLDWSIIYDPVSLKYYIVIEGFDDGCPLS